jgi:uncharacterized protein
MGASNEGSQFERGIAHFNAGEFFKAHELWEELWLRAPLQEKPFLQGIIQIAAAFHHLQRGNERGAKSLLAAGLAKVRRYSALRNGIDVPRLCHDVQAWLEILERGGRSADARLPRIHAHGRKTDLGRRY